MAAKTLPVTRADVEKVPDLSNTNPNPVMAVLAIGLTPIFPTILVVPVVVIPVLERMANTPAHPRYTGGWTDPTTTGYGYGYGYGAATGACWIAAPAASSARAAVSGLASIVALISAATATERGNGAGMAIAPENVDMVISLRDVCSERFAARGRFNGDNTTHQHVAVLF